VQRSYILEKSSLSPDQRTNGMEMPGVVRDEDVDRVPMIRVLRWVSVSMRMLLLYFTSQ
jgi:hypothetical protein